MKSVQGRADKMDSISIEETNKIRVALGMPPLPVPGVKGGPVFKESKTGEGSEDDDEASTLERRQAAAYSNYKKLKDEADDKKKREQQRLELKKAREAAQKFAKLEGKGLGEADADLDTRTWLLQQKKRQKKLEKARRLEEELAERERQLLPQYTEKDLAGLKVGHEVGEFDEGDEQILTLKDAAIGEESGGDELENADLKEREKLVENLQLKKKKFVYDPNSLDENGQRTILGQYDETIGGKPGKTFTLGDQRAAAMALEADNNEDGPKRMRFTLDMIKDDVPTSDYLEPSEIKLRKPKKSKKEKKVKRQRDADEDGIFPIVEEPAPQTQKGDVMETDEATTNETTQKPKKRNYDTSFADDDDLQSSLAMQRRAALKKRKKMRPEDLARHLREEASATPGVVESNETPDAEEPGLVIDETSEFVAHLQRPATPEPRKRTTPKPSEGISTPARAAAAVATRQPDADGDINMEHQSYNDSPDREQKSDIKKEATPITGLDEEGTLDRGLGGTLGLLRQRGFLKGTSPEHGDINAQHRDRQRFLAHRQTLESAAERHARTQRERDRLSGKLDRMSAREREEYARWENKQRDQAESRQLADVFNKEYKPNVELKYVDEHGRHMGQKEAFKHLSHMFHGKGSGKGKMEKRLRKIETEKEGLAKSNF